MENAIKSLEEFKTTALTELDAVSNYLALDCFQQGSEKQSEGDRDNEPKNILQFESASVNFPLTLRES